MFFNSFAVNLIVLLFSAFVGLYFYLSRTFNFWKSLGVSSDKPIVFFGTIWKLFFTPITEYNVECSRRYGKIYGVYFGSRPVLMIADPELVRDMNIKDFNKFVDRNDLHSYDPFNDRSLFNLKGNEWKTMRSIISPTFSSGKMRKMHPIIVGCVQRLEKYLEAKAVNKSEIELKKVMSNLTMDVIATCAFGTQIDVYKEGETHKFVSEAKKIFNFTWRPWLSLILQTTLPKVLKWTQLSMFEPSVTEYFGDAIRNILSNRKSGKVKHNDYLQLLINAQNKVHEIEEQEVPDLDNRLYGESDGKHFDVKQSIEIKEIDIIANSILFLAAGYETTASLLSHLFYLLALDEKCQQKLYEEVNQFNGEYNYESIASMPYMEACVAETLRLYNPLPETERMTAEEYTLGNTGITLPKGTLVNFDVQSIQRNPEYYPEPEKWDPERFMPENRDKLVPYTYMPFGIGPRNCVGMRFALMEAKTAIAHLVYKYKFARTVNTTVPLRAKKGDFVINTGDKVVRIELRN